MVQCKSLYCPHIECMLERGHKEHHIASNGLSWDIQQFTKDSPEIKNPQEYGHYFKNVEKFVYIDVYRVLELFAVTDPCIQHAVKKLLVAGGRGSKDIGKDIEEAIVSLKRWQQMRYEENGNKES